MGKSKLSQHTHFSIVPFHELFNWSVQYLTKTKIGFTTAYPMVRIGDFLKRNRTSIVIKDKEEYVRVKIKTHNGGVKRREKKNVLGKDIGTKKQYVISEGQFIISKIDARNGAMGIVPKELEGAIVTQDFLPYDIDTDIIIPQYLVLVSTTNPFLDFCQSCSSGTTNHQRIDEEKKKKKKIPVPTLEEQENIVSVYYKLIEEAKKSEKEAEEVDSEIKEWFIANLGISDNKIKRNNSILQFIKYRNLIKWSIEEIQRYDKFSFDQAKYEVKRIGDVILSFQGGKTPSTERKDYWGEDVYWVSAKDMKELYLLNIQDKLTQKGVNESKLRIYPKWTILGVFRSSILRHSFPICVTAHPVTINQDIKAFSIDGKKTKKLYFMFYLNLLQDIVLNVAMKKGVTVESINADAFMNSPFVCPPMIKQNEIVRYIYEKKKLIYQKRKEAKQLRLQAINDFETKIYL